MSVAVEREQALITDKVAAAGAAAGASGVCFDDRPEKCGRKQAHWHHISSLNKQRVDVWLQYLKNG